MAEEFKLKYTELDEKGIPTEDSEFTISMKAPGGGTIDIYFKKGQGLEFLNYIDENKLFAETEISFPLPIVEIKN